VCVPLTFGMPAGPMSARPNAEMNASSATPIILRAYDEQRSAAHTHPSGSGAYVFVRPRLWLVDLVWCSWRV
jgi:hypothetical protein